MGLVTVDEAKLLGATGSNEKISFLIESVSARFDSYCGQTLASSERSDKFAGSGGEEIQLPSRPLQIVSLVKIDGTTVTDYSVLSLADAILYRASGWPRNLPTWPDLTADPIPWAAEANIEVTYTAGFTQIPYDLKEACIREVIRALNIPANGRELVGERTPGGWDQRWSAPAAANGSNFLPSTMKVLNDPRFKRVFYA